MKRSLVLVFCGVLLFAFTKPAHAFKNGDVQLWSTTGVGVKLNDRWKVKAEEELRFGDDVSTLYYTHTDGGVVLKVNDNLDLGANYRQVFEKKNGEWKEEYRPHCNAVLKWTWYDFTLSDRNRLEYRIRSDEDKDDAWRYRNKLSVKAPWKWTDFEVQPYIADEIFVDFYGEKINRNRLYAGITAKLVKHLKMDLFYLWQVGKKDADWSKTTSYNVIGIKLKAAF